MYMDSAFAVLLGKSSPKAIGTRSESANLQTSVLGRTLIIRKAVPCFYIYVMSREDWLTLWPWLHVYMTDRYGISTLGHERRSRNVSGTPYRPNSDVVNARVFACLISLISLRFKKLKKQVGHSRLKMNMIGPTHKKYTSRLIVLSTNRWSESTGSTKKGNMKMVWQNNLHT